MAKIKLSDDTDGMTPPAGLPPRHVFAVGERVSRYGIMGEVGTQDGPWTVTVQQDRGGKINAAVTLLVKA